MVESDPQSVRQLSLMEIRHKKPAFYAKLHESERYMASLLVTAYQCTFGGLTGRLQLFVLHQRQQVVLTIVFLQV